MSNITRSQRRERAYKFAVTGGVTGALGAVGLVLAILGVVGAGIPLLLLVVAAIAGYLFKKTVA